MFLLPGWASAQFLASSSTCNHIVNTYITCFQKSSLIEIGSVEHIIKIFEYDDVCNFSNMSHLFVNRTPYRVRFHNISLLERSTQLLSYLRCTDCNTKSKYCSHEQNSEKDSKYKMIRYNIYICRLQQVHKKSTIHVPSSIFNKFYL